MEYLSIELKLLISAISIVIILITSAYYEINLIYLTIPASIYFLHIMSKYEIIEHEKKLNEINKGWLN